MSRHVKVTTYDRHETAMLGLPANERRLYIDVAAKSIGVLCREYGTELSENTSDGCQVRTKTFTLPDDKTAVRQWTFKVQGATIEELRDAYKRACPKS